MLLIRLSFTLAFFEMLSQINLLLFDWLVNRVFVWYIQMYTANQLIKRQEIINF